MDVNLDLANRFFAFEFYKVLLGGKKYGEGYALHRFYIEKTEEQ